MCPVTYVCHLVCRTQAWGLAGPGRTRHNARATPEKKTRAGDLRRTLAMLEPNQPDHAFESVRARTELDRIQGRAQDEAWRRKRVEDARRFTTEHPQNPPYREYLHESLRTDRSRDNLECNMWVFFTHMGIQFVIMILSVCPYFL